MPALPSEIAALVPGLDAAEAMRFGAYLVLAVLWPGWIVRRRLGLRGGSRAERWTLDVVLGVLWLSLAYYALARFGLERWHAAWPAATIVVHLATAGRGRANANPRCRRAIRSWTKGWTAGEAAAMLVLAAFVGLYVARVRASVEPAVGQDGSPEVRLYGALFSDKQTGSWPCGALVNRVPPEDLRLAGYRIPYHFFPHLFVAVAHHAADVNLSSGFWFYAAALGMAANGLSIAAFCRRRFRWRWAAAVGVALIGIGRFTTEFKPLDLSVPLLLLALGCLDRAGASRQRRWWLAAVVFLGATPLYETLHGAAVGLALAVWSSATAIGWVRRRTSAAGGRALFAFSTAAATAVAMAGAMSLLFAGSKTVAPTQWVLKNSYRASFRDDVAAAGRQNPDGWQATLLRWKQGPPSADGAVPRPAAWQRAVGAVGFELGWIGYFVLYFVNAALLGLVALLSDVRRTAPAPGTALLAALAVAGFALPAVASFGNWGDGRWWDSATLYRFATIAHLGATLAGVGLLAEAWRRPRLWAGAATAAWYVVWKTSEFVAPAMSYLPVRYAQLEALAELRRVVAPHQVALTPWIDDPIYTVGQPRSPSYIYKRHATLGAGVALVPQFYEGPEYHLFHGGFVAADEVYRRSRLRQRFYRHADAAAAESVFRRERIDWIVEDAALCGARPLDPPPQWHIAWRNGTVKIYRRHQPQPSPR